MGGSTAEVYLNVHASALRERAAAVRSCGTDLARHGGVLTSCAPSAAFGPWVGAVVGPSPALGQGLSEVARALDGGMRAVRHETGLIAHAMMMAAERYTRTDVLPQEHR